MKTVARLAAAWVALAMAIWLAPAAVEIAAWPPSGPVRIAFLPPLARLWIAGAIVAVLATVAIVLWRRSGRSLDDLSRALAPLALLLLWLVPFLPWLPDRAPILVMLAGPVRWVIAGAAACGCAVAFWVRLTGRRTKRSDPVETTVFVQQPRLVARGAIFAVSVALYVVFGLGFANEVGFTGDEPHYLVIAHSLLADRDLDIANNHARGDYRAFYGAELRPDYLRRGVHGEIYSIHAPGLAAVVLPAYAVAGANGAVVLVALLAGLAALAIFDTASAIGGPAIGAVVWASTTLTVPFVPHAWLIYPEAVGALIVAWAVRWQWSAEPSAARSMGHGAALALLPWLHTKFVVLLAGLALVEAIRLRSRPRNVIAFAAPIAISTGLWLLAFYFMYGAFDPQAPYGASAGASVLVSNIPRSLLGLLVDQKFGLLPYSPVYALAVAGAWLSARDRRHRGATLGLLAVAAAFVLSSARFYMWWGGGSAPARFLVPIVPLLAPAIAIAAARLRSNAGRAAVGAAIAWSLVVAVACVTSPGERLLYSDPHGTAAAVQAVQGSAPLDVSLPTFTEENWRAPLVPLALWLAAAAIAAFVVMLAVRAGMVRSALWIGATALMVFFATGSAIAGRWVPSSRDVIARRGQLSLMQQYDPSRLRAVDCTSVGRLSDEDVRKAVTVSVRRHPRETESSLEGPIELPAGEYEARVWFERPAGAADTAFVRLAENMVIAQTEASGAPAVMPFSMQVSAAVFVGATAGAVSRVEIVPTSIVPRSLRPSPPARLVELLSGQFPGYMAYIDRATFPEGGVFWTRGTETGSVAIAKPGAASLRLILHVGPAGGPVLVTASEWRDEIEMAPNETRTIDVPLEPYVSPVIVTARARRSFRPADVDPKSDDRRWLGVQVRPQLYW